MKQGYLYKINILIFIPTTRSKLNEIKKNDEGEKDDAPT